VFVTAQCFWKLAAMYEKHAIDAHPASLVSPASLIKAYYRKMGITPLRERFADFPEDLMGAAMSAYLGGQVEALAIRVPLPVCKIDILSAYPSVCCLADLWKFIIAKSVRPVDTTEETRTLLDSITYESLLEPGMQSRLNGFVLCVPDGGMTLPCRADYGQGDQSIGFNYLDTRGAPLWFALPDLVKGKIAGGRVPRIIRAFGLEAGEPLEDLKDVRIYNTLHYDPRTSNMAKAVIELRKSAKGNPAIAPADAKFLDLFLKVFANSGFYGMFAEVNRDEGNAHDFTYETTLEEWKDSVSAEAARIADVQDAASSPYWDALAAVGGRIVPDIRYDARRKCWKNDGEFADVPKRLLRSNTRRNPEGRAYGNVDELTDIIRRSTGQDDLTTSEVLDFFAQERRPSPSLAYEEAREERAGDRPELPRTACRIVGRKVYTTDVVYPEDPGQYFFAPLAALVTAHARLLLGLLQVAVERRGGFCAYRDTDSQFVLALPEGGLVPCPGGPYTNSDGVACVRALSYAQVDDIQKELDVLHPYDRALVSEPLFKYEDDNYALTGDLDERGKPHVDKNQREPLWLYALSEKRYALFNYGHDGRISLRGVTEHGLGQFMRPTPGWTGETWQYVLECAHGREPEPPAFFAFPAVSQLVFTTHAYARPFSSNQLGGKIPPFDFLLVAQAAPRDLYHAPASRKTRYVAPFETDSDRWKDAAWVNLYSNASLEEEDEDVELVTFGMYVKRWLRQSRVLKLRLATAPADYDVPRGVSFRCTSSRRASSRSDERAAILR